MPNPVQPHRDGDGPMISGEMSEGLAASPGIRSASEDTPLRPKGLRLVSVLLFFRRQETECNWSGIRFTSRDRDEVPNQRFRVNFGNSAGAKFAELTAAFLKGMQEKTRLGNS